jgi:hypothetical protein
MTSAVGIFDLRNVRKFILGGESKFCVTAIARFFLTGTRPNYFNIAKAPKGAFYGLLVNFE